MYNRKIVRSILKSTARRLHVKESEYVNQQFNYRRVRGTFKRGLFAKT